MSFDTRFESPSPRAARTMSGDALDTRAAEAIELVELTEVSFHFGPARGIFNAVVIGAGVWLLIFAAVALTRSIFFG